MLLTLLACEAPGLSGYLVDLGGKVVDTYGVPVEGEVVSLTTPDGEAVGEATTDNKGAWSVVVYGSTLENNVLMGEVAAGDGHGASQATWEINLKSPDIDELRMGPGETWTSVERSLSALVVTPDADRASASGYVVDAYTGLGVSGVALSLQWGWNASVGAAAEASAETDGNGAFTFDADRPGVYTVFATGPEGYGTARFGAVLLGDGGWSRGAIGPRVDPGAFLATLTWGASPSDLDLHLSAPLRGGAVGADGNGAYHIWSGDTTHPDNLSSGAPLEAEMVREDDDGEGPETVEIYGAPGTGEVRLTVVDNTSLGAEDSTLLGLSRSTVQVWNGEDTPRYFTVGPGQEAIAWHPVAIAVPDATVWAVESYLDSIDPADGDDF